MASTPKFKMNHSDRERKRNQWDLTAKMFFKKNSLCDLYESDFETLLYKRF